MTPAENSKYDVCCCFSFEFDGSEHPVDIYCIFVSVNSDFTDGSTVHSCSHRLCSRWGVCQLSVTLVSEADVFPSCTPPSRLSSLLKAITLCSLNVAVSTTFLKSDYSLPLWSHELVDVCATVYCMCLHVSMYICLQCNFKSKSTTICPIPPLDPVSFHSYLFKCLSRWLRGGGGSKKLFWDFNYFPADVHNYFQASSASCIDCWNCVCLCNCA